jgi:hypothetical protein
VQLFPFHTRFSTFPKSITFERGCVFQNSNAAL